MKIGLYGGSFNPVHFGHVGLAKWVIEHTDLDELWLIVSPNNPLKPAGILAPEEERLRGVQEAIQDIPHVKASNFEFGLPRPSYTANTLRELQKAYPEHEFTLVIGEDNLAIFDQWREYKYIASNFRIFVYPRKGSSIIEDCRLKIEDFHSLLFLKEAPLFDISSTELRQRGNCCHR
ncbi:MAG: nicotinate (nicotinamide) nucleotide adenylyltransferase [Paludibacteraceae bacterium]|nr:nicotinate (nicotinamide) nucleotide adenylyltransferase [Paludibacteraceae bacterium]